ncbi:hypothetical protein L5515_010569 [Caenorhabditis briggsae]|uniref:Uncharacterized protein n=1 Tax=Caenorhabditis briggsae TaxID=6238 RepID=A0AAE9EQL2_CAEBR|nr:hypothetical protein L5515_010569 [Caenorhabditis briggsae]
MSPPSKVMIVSPMIERKPVPYLATPRRSIEIKPQFLLPRNDDFDAQLSGEAEEFLASKVERNVRYCYECPDVVLKWSVGSSWLWYEQLL